MSRLSWCVCLVIAYSAGASAAASSDPRTFPLKASLRLAEGPTREAFQAALDRMFRPATASGDPDLVFDVLVDPKDRGAIVEGNHVYFAARVVVASPQGGEIGRFRVRGSGDTLSQDPGSAQYALLRAVDDAAGRVPDEFVESEPVARWLAARGLTPAASTSLWRERPEYLGFLDLSGGMMLGDGVAPGVLATAGFAGKWFVVQGTFGYWSMPQDIDMVGSDDFAVGFEMGPVYRINRNVEVRGGAGAFVLWGSIGNGYADYDRITPTLFAAFQYTSAQKGETAFRWRGGLEIRQHFSGSEPLPKVRLEVTVAGFYAGAFVGFELGG